MVRFFFAIVAALTWAPAHAELIERDWLATGDGLLTFNPASGREWLDITVTELQQYGDTVDDAVSTAKDLLAAGDLLPGFMLAGRVEVEELLQAAGYSDDENLGDNIDATRALITFFDGSISPNGNGRLQAVVDELAPPPLRFSQPAYLAFYVSSGSASPAFPRGRGIAGLTHTVDSYRQSSVQNTGLLVFRNAVPEPTALMTIAMLAPWLLLHWKMRLSG